jgi:hypothetical protein
MITWQQFLESRTKTTTTKVDCIEDIAKALQKIFKSYTRTTRQAAWKKITSKKGESLVQDLIHTPTRNLSSFRTLVP